jgi:hypothetical protein
MPTTPPMPLKSKEDIEKAPSPQSSGTKLPTKDPTNIPKITKALILFI